MTSDNLDLVPGGAGHDWLTDPPQQGEEAWCIQQHQPAAPPDSAVQLHSITVVSWLACCMSAGGCVLFCLILHQLYRRSFCIHSNSVCLHGKYGAQADKSACKSADSTNDDSPFWEDVQRSARQPDHVLPPTCSFHAKTHLETANRPCIGHKHLIMQRGAYLYRRSG